MARSEPTREETVTLEIATGLLVEALENLRALTPEGWDMAWYTALGRYHTSDVAMLKDARLLSMRGGPRFKP